MASHENLAALSKKTIIRFAPDNQSKFLPSDSVVFNLRAKNAKRILVRVFEIKTFEYLQQHGQNKDVEGLGMNLNLDGLTPNWEHHLTLDKPSIEMHDVTIELTELANRRGAFVMDVISNGENSSAYFTKVSATPPPSPHSHTYILLGRALSSFVGICDVFGRRSN